MIFYDSLTILMLATSNGPAYHTFIINICVVVWFKVRFLSYFNDEIMSKQIIHVHLQSHSLYVFIAYLIILCIVLLLVVFMDEAGLPEESHESLKVITIIKEILH